MAPRPVHLLLSTLILATVSGCALFDTRPAEVAPAILDRLDPAPVAPAIVPLEPGAMPERLTLEQALDIAWRQSPTLRSAFLRLEAARARVSQAWSGYLPTVQGGLSASRTLESAASPAMSIPGFDPDDNYWSYGSSLTLSYRVFDGLAREYRILQARRARDETAASLSDARRLVAKAVGATFFSALLAREQLAVARESLAFNRKMLADARKRRDAGMGSEADVLSFQVRVNSAQTETITAESGLRTQRLALAELLGLVDGVWPRGVRLEAPADTAVRPEVDGAGAVRQALTARPDLIGARLAVERTGAAVGEAWSAFFPTLSAFAQAGHQRRDDAEFSIHDLSATAGFDLSWTLFGGGSRFGAIRAARANVKAAQADVERRRRAVITEVLQAVTALDDASRKVSYFRRNADLSRRLRDMEATSFERGNTTRTTLDQAQTDYTVARLQLAIGRLSVHMARFNLDIATGEVAEKGDAARDE